MRGLGSLSAELSVDKVRAAIEQVIASMLSLRIANAEAILDSADKADLISSSVRFNGAWRGSCVVTCPRPVATEITCRFLGFDLDNHEDVVNEVRDCMGEVANIVGGNIKNCMPRGVDHSVPEFKGGRPAMSELVLATKFECSRGVLDISLFQLA